jgi:hypothetical protein
MPPRREAPWTSELRIRSTNGAVDLAYVASSHDVVSPYTDSQVLMKNASTSTKKKSGVATFSDAAKVVVDKMVARTPVVKVPSSHRLSK